MTEEKMKIRKRVIKSIASILEKLPQAKEAPMKFDMRGWVVNKGETVYDATTSTYKPSCGTSACIAGWVVALYDEDGKKREKPLTGKQLRRIEESLHNDIAIRARKTLGLDGDVAEGLFAPARLEFIDEPMAAEVLRNLAATGEVVWDQKLLKRRQAKAQRDYEKSLAAEKAAN